MKRSLIIALLISMAILTACSGANKPQQSAAPKQEADNTEESAEMKQITMSINDEEVEVSWEDNESVKALKDLCQDGPLTIRMSMYGGFEQVGPIGQGIVRDDVQTTTEPGDIVLYSGDQIVIFYGSNSWAYTRLGHVELSREELEDLLGNGDVVLTIQ